MLILRLKIGLRSIKFIIHIRFLHFRLIVILYKYQFKSKHPILISLKFMNHLNYEFHQIFKIVISLILKVFFL